MRKDNDALAQRKSTVETEVIEEAVETHDFAINKRCLHDNPSVYYLFLPNLKSVHPSLQIQISSRPALTHNLQEPLSLFFYLHSHLSPVFLFLFIFSSKQEQDIIDRENMRKDNDALAQRKSTVENKVTEEAVETEVIEEAVEIHDFSIDFKGTTFLS
jgi:hypothetical protein